MHDDELIGLMYDEPKSVQKRRVFHDSYYLTSACMLFVVIVYVGCILLVPETSKNNEQHHICSNIRQNQTLLITDVVMEVDLYPNQMSSVNWNPPESPSVTEFDNLHPAYPPARFLAAFANGQWTEDFDRFELHPNPPLFKTLPFQHIINEWRVNFNVTQHTRNYCEQEEDSTYGVDNLPLNKSCAKMHWYTSSQACWIMSHFTVIHIVGDSLMRHIYAALLQIMSDNWKDGQVNINALNKTGETVCTNDFGYEEITCRDTIAFDWNTAARKLCPRLHLDDLPNNWKKNIEFNTQYQFDDDYEIKPFVDLITQPSYRHVFVREEIGQDQRYIPPMLTTDQRKNLQRKRVHKRRRTSQPYQGGGLDTHSNIPFNWSMADREEFVFPLPNHIGALIIEEQGYHAVLTSNFPDSTINYYHEETNVLLYESHTHSPPLPIFPLYLGLHATIAPLIKKREGHSWIQKLDKDKLSSMSHTINIHLQTHNDPSFYYQAILNQSPSLIDLSTLHYASHVNTGQPMSSSKEFSYWSLDSRSLNCNFTSAPVGAFSKWSESTSRSCCSHSVRPWQFLDPLGLTSKIPFSWSYDGTHYKQRINLYKAQAILNYAHTIIQQQKRIKQSKP